MQDYDPWDHLERHFPEVRLITHLPLPSGRVGGISGRRLWLDRDLDKAGQRSTLAHEIVHLERMHRAGPRGRRGECPDESEFERICLAREENAVDAIAARRLIPLASLIDAVRWSTDRRELAAELGVDDEMLAARVAGLTPAERSAVSGGLLA